jgi:sec-independent protein translocase protein TatC
MIPFAIILAVFFDIIPLQKFKELRKVFIVFSFFISAVITPPDILSQIVISILIIILYEMGIIFSHTKLLFKKST